MITPLTRTPLLRGTLQNLFYPPQEYIYFKRALEVPFPILGTIPKAAWAADAAMLAYARYGQNRMTEEQLAKNFDRAQLKYEKWGSCLSTVDSNR